MENNKENPLMRNIKFAASLIGVAVVFGTIFYNQGYTDSTNNQTAKNQAALKETIKETIQSLYIHMEGENKGARADQERADACLQTEMLLRDEILDLKSQLRDYQNKKR